MRARGRRASISVYNPSCRAIAEAPHKMEKRVYFIYNIVYVH
jgi:hypothetical protein